jgi:hypothetical protein
LNNNHALRQRKNRICALFPWTSAERRRIVTLGDYGLSRGKGFRYQPNRLFENWNLDRFANPMIVAIAESASSLMDPVVHGFSSVTDST